MTATGLITLLPLEIASVTAIVVLLLAAFHRCLTTATALTLGGLFLAFVTLFASHATADRQITPLFIFDDYALFYMGLIFAASFAVAAFSHGYLKLLGIHAEEYYVLLLAATVGSAALAASSHFASFFLGLETLSVSLYALIAYTRTRHISIEAAIKYVILAAASAAFLLFGIALIYAELGSLEFGRVAVISAASEHTGSLVLLSGLGLILVGIGFKLAVVPFHLWTPDVYQGAPAPVTAFVATASKGAMFALLLRYFTLVDIHARPSVLLAVAIVAIASMIAGNLLALLQNNVKRILAYSSIAHLGYLLVAFMAAEPYRAIAVAFYLASYFVTTLGSFGIITLVSGRDHDAEDLGDYRGLFWRRPWLAGAFTAMLLSLAGIPLTAGFVAKFYVLVAGVDAALRVSVVVLVVASVIGLFYYLRIIVALFAATPEEGGATLGTAERPLAWVGAAALAVLTLILVWLGIYPAPLLDFIASTVLNAS